MKRIFTLLTSLVFTLALFAAARPKSTLIIKSDLPSDIRVVIDGRRFEPNDNFMAIRDMRPGYHSIKIYREKSFGIFTIFGHSYDMVFNSSLLMKPHNNVLISIDRFGRARVMTNRNHRDFNWGDRDMRHDHDYDFDNGHNYGDYGNRDRNGNDRDSRWGDRDDDHGDYGNNGGYTRAMTDREFETVLDNISRERFENNMMKSATQVVNTNYFTSEQVKEMLQLFDSEDRKLDLAKLAYGKTVDPRNYFVVNDVFHFNDSKEELARYIRSH